MKLEEIVKMYGKNDYYEMNTGRIYQLSNTIIEGNKEKVPVIENGILIGYAVMEVQNG